MNSTILMNIHMANTSAGYRIGIFIAVLILFYLLYALIRPERF